MQAGAGTRGGPAVLRALLLLCRVRKHGAIQATESTGGQEGAEAGERAGRHLEALNKGASDQGIMEAHVPAMYVTSAVLKPEV